MEGIMTRERFKKQYSFSLDSDRVLLGALRLLLNISPATEIQEVLSITEDKYAYLMGKLPSFIKEEEQEKLRYINRKKFTKCS